MAARKPSHAAIVAKAIRNELKEKFPDAKFSVRVEPSRLGSISVSWKSVLPSPQEVCEITDKYGYNKGYDILDNTIRKRRDDVPQVEFVSLHHGNYI